MAKLSKSFSRFAEATSRYAGRPVVFLLAVAIVVIWAASGPLFHFGDTWQLVINTGTTIITFLMVFLIQNSQNREGSSLHIKLDELIRVTHAQNGLLNLEGLDDETLEKIRAHYQKLACSAKQNARSDGEGVDMDFDPVDQVLRAAAAEGVADAAVEAKSAESAGKA